MYLRLLLLSLVISFAGSCASSINPHVDSNREDNLDLIHSDLPLFGYDEDEKIWPRSFRDEESFGCTSSVAFGDWALSTRANEEVDWYRIENYGVFHCWAVVSNAYEEELLDAVESKPAFFIFLGIETINNQAQELWVLQIGARPGSEYILLSRNPELERIETFQVLQRKCPRGKIRDSGNLSIILTRYCAINTRTEFLRFARNMMDLDTVGTLSLVSDNVEN
jgi:hypothetical protein